ncbi:hypothetical protein B0H14DRAFT_2642384 [Mycena olivaceomarginata]|nr:hypothetical protein B0H14DRAFT_2642384 [Mycena olivaceomarginata]
MLRAPSIKSKLDDAIYLTSPQNLRLLSPTSPVSAPRFSRQPMYQALLQLRPGSPKFCKTSNAPPASPPGPQTSATPKSIALEPHSILYHPTRPNRRNPQRHPAVPVNSSFEYVQSDLARRTHSVAIWNRPSIIDTFSVVAGNPREKGKVIPVMVRGFGYSARRRIHTETGTRFSDSTSGGHQLTVQTRLIHPELVIPPNSYSYFHGRHCDPIFRGSAN